MKVKHPKGPPRGTTPASRTTQDRYRIRKGGLLDNWLIEDTHAGTYLQIKYATSAEAAEYADQLNKGHL